MSDLGNKKIFSNNLNFYMQLHDKDRNKIAKDLKLNYSTVRDWTNGRAYPRIDKIEMLAEYFGIQKSDLIENKDILLVEGERDAILFNHIMKLAKDKIEQELLVKCTMLDLANQKKLLELANLYLKNQGDYAEKSENNIWVVKDKN